MGGFNFAPKAHALCNGQILSIQQNQALFAILGTTYGGNGTTTFALPNLQGCIPFHWGASPSGGGSFVLGQVGGEINHTLLQTEMPQHTHQANATSATANAGSPAGAFWANGGHQLYANTGGSLMAAQAVGIAGGSQPHPNMPPYLVVNFYICISGVFPSQN